MSGVSLVPFLHGQCNSAAAKGKIEALLAGEPDATAIAEHVASAVGLTDAAYSIQETFWAVRRLFEAVARTRPLVVEFDDIHWAEPTFSPRLLRRLRADSPAPSGDDRPAVRWI